MTNTANEKSQGDWQAGVEVRISAFSSGSQDICHREFSETQEMARNLGLCFQQESPKKTSIQQDHKKITPSAFIHSKDCCIKGGNLYSLEVLRSQEG